MYILILLLKIYNIVSFNRKSNIPSCLWGKKLILNGPKENKELMSPFDGSGHITSVAFYETHTHVSETILPEEKSLTFPLGDFLKRNYLELMQKLPYVISNPYKVQSGTRNTAVCKFDNQLYATEESCKPMILNYDHNDNIVHSGISKNIDRMSPHMIDDNTFFSYTHYIKYPLQINNTFHIPWTPKQYPFLIHDGKSTQDNKYFVFPLMSTSMGNLWKYFTCIINIPFDGKSRKMSWLIYNRRNNSTFEVKMNEYTDVFHISSVQKLYNNVYRIHASFVYNFSNWICGKGNIDIRLKEIIIDFDNEKLLEVIDTGLKMDFVHKYGNKLIGSCLNEKPSVIIYDIISKTHRMVSLPGNSVREIIPYKDLLLYFSHEIDESYLFVVDFTGNIINKISIPHRLPGFHTSLF
jgi:hypothetical protein